MQIYLLRSPNTQAVYIGSTSNPLCVRLATHVLKWHYWCTTGRQSYLTSAGQVIDAGDATIELLEDCSGMCKKDVLRREGYLTSITPHCVNINKSGRTRSEWVEDSGLGDLMTCPFCNTQFKRINLATHLKSQRHGRNAAGN